MNPKPDAELVFMDVATARKMLAPNTDHAFLIDALKNFKITQGGSDQKLVWFGQLVNTMKTAAWRKGMPMKDGTTRYVTLTNGGPVFVFVKDDKIVRTTPIDLEEDDGPSWSITARGRRFSPARRATVSPHALSLKSLVYSDKRLLYPMKRVDFDPNGERNPQNRGISGYERISWDEALDIVAGEIRRMKKDYGPGAIAMVTGAHHQWGNINYYLSAMLRFGNLIGFTRVEPSPISWEGWYWGAMHHYGNSLRLGTPSFYGTTEDCLQHAEVIVFWSSDPESTSGVYGGFEGTERRLWAKQLGIEFVHIDPYLTHSAQFLGGKWLPIKPGTDSALAIAIMHEWMVSGSYDKEYVDVENDRLRRMECLRPRRRGRHTEDAGMARSRNRCARQGCPQSGAVVGVKEDLSRSWRSGRGLWWRMPHRDRCSMGAKRRHDDGDAGMGETGNQLRQFADRCTAGPQFLLSRVRRGRHLRRSEQHRERGQQLLPHASHHHDQPGEAVRSASTACRSHRGRTRGRLRVGRLLDRGAVCRSTRIRGRAYSRIHMLYRYGSSSFGTTPGSNRLVEAYRHSSLEFIVNQSIWMENEAQFADIILPACTALERDDIAEWANCGGYIQHAQTQLNHRMVIMQHKCIEPLGESKSDYQIFLDILTRLGYGGMFSEGGCSELSWCERMFNSTDLAQADHLEEVPAKGLSRRAAAEGRRQAACRHALVCGRPSEGSAGTESATWHVFDRLRRRAADAVGQVRVRAVEPASHRTDRSRKAGRQPVHEPRQRRESNRFRCSS